MNSMGIIALDLGLRGATAALFLMAAAVVLVRARPLDAIKLLAAAMAASGATYVIATAPFVPKSTLWWTLPLLAANPVIVWLWASATFDDDFVVRRWHGALWLIVVGIGFTVSLSWTAWPVPARAGGRLLSLVALILALSAIVQTVRTWGADLVAGRRRLRLAIVTLSVLFIVVLAGSDLMSISSASVGISGSLLSTIGLLAVAIMAGWGLFYPPPANPAIMATAIDPPGSVTSIARSEPRADSSRDSIAPVLLRRLDHLMSVERIYRQEGLTIAALAARLDLPEHRLRQVINEGLGHRNFNAFLNRYRIDEAKAALSDPSQREVPVLTIAMDAGFQSIGPFNRAFKADTGVTPTEFRRDALARSQADTTESIDKSVEGHSAREIG
jgi:AraC-like DNA-binding protein